MEGSVIRFPANHLNDIGVDQEPFSLSNFAFNGQWNDVVSNLYYLRKRYYDGFAGRFITNDPLGIWGDGENLGNGKAYCANNPIDNEDSTGLLIRRDGKCSVQYVCVLIKDQRGTADTPEICGITALIYTGTCEYECQAVPESDNPPGCFRKSALPSLYYDQSTTYHLELPPPCAKDKSHGVTKIQTKTGPYPLD